MNIVHTLQLLDCACHTQGCKDQFTTIFFWPIIHLINGKISEESAYTSCAKRVNMATFSCCFFVFFQKICRNTIFLFTAFNASVTTSESLQSLYDNIYIPMTHLDHNTFQNSSVQENYFVTVPDTFFSHVIFTLLEQQFLFCHSIKTITAVSDGVHEVHALKVQMEILVVIRFHHLISEMDSNKLLPTLINHFQP